MTNVGIVKTIRRIHSGRTEKFYHYDCGYDKFKIRNCTVDEYLSRYKL